MADSGVRGIAERLINIQQAGRANQINALGAAGNIIQGVANVAGQAANLAGARKSEFSTGPERLELARKVHKLGIPGEGGKKGFEFEIPGVGDVDYDTFVDEMVKQKRLAQTSTDKKIRQNARKNLRTMRKEYNRVVPGMSHLNNLIMLRMRDDQLALSRQAAASRGAGDGLDDLKDIQKLAKDKREQTIALVPRQLFGVADPRMMTPAMEKISSDTQALVNRLTDKAVYSDDRDSNVVQATGTMLRDAQNVTRAATVPSVLQKRFTEQNNWIKENIKDPEAKKLALTQNMLTLLDFAGDEDGGANMMRLYIQMRYPRFLQQAGVRGEDFRGGPRNAQISVSNMAESISENIIEQAREDLNSKDKRRRKRAEMILGAGNESMVKHVRDFINKADKNLRGLNVDWQGDFWGDLDLGDTAKALDIVHRTLNTSGSGLSDGAPISAEDANMVLDSKDINNPKYRWIILSAMAAGQIPVSGLLDKKNGEPVLIQYDGTMIPVDDIMPSIKNYIVASPTLKAREEKQAEVLRMEEQSRKLKGTAFNE